VIDAGEHADYVELGSLAVGTHRIAIDLTLEDKGQDLSSIPGLLIWTGTVEIEVRVVEGSDEIVRPIDSRELSEAVKRSLQRVDASGRTILQFRARQGEFPALTETALSLEFELFRGNHRIDQAWGFVRPVGRDRPCGTADDPGVGRSLLQRFRDTSSGSFEGRLASLGRKGMVERDGFDAAEGPSRPPLNPACALS